MKFVAFLGNIGYVTRIHSGFYSMADYATKGVSPPKVINLPTILQHGGFSVVSNQESQILIGVALPTKLYYPYDIVIVITMI